MKLQYILLENFRNHSSTLVNCSLGVNLFLGDNGEGKTNILEGISYLCLSKSYYAVNDAVVMKIGEPGFAVTGKMLSDSGVEHEVRVEFNREKNQKDVSINRAKINKTSLLIGLFPIVILTSEQSAVTIGTPADRRQFIDFVLSQSSRTYLENLINYRRILRQRNKILSEIQSTLSEDSCAIEPWNENLVKIGTAVMKKRIEFISDFQSMMVDSYAQIAGTNERPIIMYEPSFECGDNNAEAMISLFSQALRDRFSDERRTGYSLVGPHRDEFVFYINNLNARNYASQGQHKTLLVALKMAEFYYLKDRCNEVPILLLDDVFSELDQHRSKCLLETAANIGQTFVTSTDEHAHNWMSVASANMRKFFVKEGKIERVEDETHIY